VAQVKHGEPLGRIVTFYSYKGGTGRSMALANVAWILASQGQRVLAIDWDLEAPGLHRYFHPFIDDKELGQTPGLIDLLSDFVEGARRTTRGDSDWFEPYANVGHHAFSLDWEFPGEGTLDLLPAGRQGRSYAVRVTGFDWADFYERLGGGVFLEAFKRGLRAEYDYILIDSRTGMSDASGICTVQMPDELVVCFTLNAQSVRGAVAVAESALEQRVTPERAQGIRIWPVPMRVELNERDQLERARDDARARFQRLLHHVPSNQRSAYWGSVEVLYQPYFAYAEVLAALADRRQQTGSLLGSFESLTRYLTDGAVDHLGELDEIRRAAALAAYRNIGLGPFYLSYSREDEEFATRLVDELRRRFGPDSILWDRDLLEFGTPWADTLATAMNRAKLMMALIGPGYIAGQHARREAEYALNRGIRVVPLLRGDANVTWSSLESFGEPFSRLARIHGFAFSEDPKVFESEVETLARQLQSIVVGEASNTSPLDLSDPNRHRFGGKSERDGFALTAKVTEISKDLFEVRLKVTGPLTGDVEFHLHPTFTPMVRRVPSESGRADLHVEAWGAFTVGVVVLDPYTQLELDLADLTTAPPPFRER